MLNNLVFFYATATSSVCTCIFQHVLEILDGPCMLEGHTWSVIIIKCHHLEHRFVCLQRDKKCVSANIFLTVTHAIVCVCIFVGWFTVTCGVFCVYISFCWMVYCELHMETLSFWISVIIQQSWMFRWVWLL